MFEMFNTTEVSKLGHAKYFYCDILLILTDRRINVSSISRTKIECRFSIIFLSTLWYQYKHFNSHHFIYFLRYKLKRVQAKYTHVRYFRMLISKLANQIIVWRFHFIKTYSSFTYHERGSLLYTDTKHGKSNH